MKMIFAKFSRNGIAGILTAIGVLSALDHKIFDDAMKDGTVVPAFVCKFYKIIAVLWRVVIKYAVYVAVVGMNYKFLHAIGLLRHSLKCKCGYQSEKDCSFFHVMIILLNEF